MKNQVFTKPKVNKTGKYWYVFFYYEGKQKRYKKGLNRIKNLREREIEARALAEALRIKLMNGWNPLVPKIEEDSNNLFFSNAIDFALEKKKPNLVKKPYSNYNSTVNCVKKSVERLGLQQNKKQVMSNKEKDIKIMIASTVYGFEDQLSKVVTQLQTLNYTVLNSHTGTIKVNPQLSNLENCLNAVEECDLFLGIIRPYYGTGNIDNKNITFEEIKKAIKLKKPCWFLVDRVVIFGRLFKRKLRIKKGKDLIDTKNDAYKNYSIVLDKNNFFDERTIEIYDHVIQNDIPVPLRKGNWVQEFHHLDEMLTYIKSQFSDKNLVENIIYEKQKANS